MAPTPPTTTPRAPRLPSVAAGVTAVALAAACGPNSSVSTAGTAGAGGSMDPECAVTVTSAELSPYIPTVGIVTFTTSLANLTSAEIQFGFDTTYGYVAPVDLTEESHRTLLLGLRQNIISHYRVAVSDGDSVCYSEDGTIVGGVLNADSLRESWVTEQSAPGFIVTAHDGHAVIYDSLGELVWAYDMWNVFSVALSWDAKYMIGRDPGPFDLGTGGTFYRVKMDGSDFQEFDAPGGDHHDFAAIPEGIAYLAKTAEGECDRVYEASIDITDGTPRFDTWQIYQHFSDEGVTEGTEICHANRIHYLAEGDRYTISDRNKDAIAIFGRNGEPIMSIGKTPTGGTTPHIQAEGAGPGGAWHVQHGHHYYADDKLLVFSNESSGGAAALHYTLGESGASLDWRYDGAGASMIQGDVQHLPNGNALVTANLSGTIIEFDPNAQLEVRRLILDGPMGPLYGFTYSTHRRTLYGPPDPR